MEEDNNQREIPSLGQGGNDRFFFFCHFIVKQVNIYNY